MKPWLSAKRPSNNWALYSFGSTNDSPASIKPLYTPTSSSLFIIRLPSGVNFEGRVEAKITQGVLNNLLHVFSLAAILKFAVSVKSWTKISPSTPGSSRFPMRRLWGRCWDLSSDFPEVFEFPTIYDCISSRHFSILNDARQCNRKWNFFPFWSEIESGPTGKAGRHKSPRTPRSIPSPGVIISTSRLPGFSFTPYISVLRQNLLWLVWPTNLSVFAKTPSERMFLFSVFLSLLPVKV